MAVDVSSARIDRDAATESQPVTRLFRKLADDLATLFRKELALAASEIRESIGDVKRGVAALIGGAAVLGTGLLVLLAAATLGLAEFMPAWAAALIVGGSITAAGGLMVWMGKRRLNSTTFAPERTGASLRKDGRMIGRQVS